MSTKRMSMIAVLTALAAFSAASMRSVPLFARPANAQYDQLDPDGRHARSAEANHGLAQHGEEPGEDHPHEGQDESHGDAGHRDPANAHGPRGDEDGGDEHGAADDHAHDESGAATVRLAPESIRRAGLKLATAGPGMIERRVRLPGEISLNADRAAHIVPRAEGVVTDVRVRVGDRVTKGQVLATLESAELAQARLQYLTALGELGGCGMDLARAEALRDSAEKLLGLLNTGPMLEDLLTADLSDMNEAHSGLVSAYAQLVLTRAAYEREEKLVRDSISSLAENQEARNAYQKAYGDYMGARSALSFETQRGLFEARQSRQNTELAVRTARKTLGILGLTPDDVDSLRAEAPDATPEADCDDPGCTDRLAHASHGAAEDHHDPVDHFGVYSLRAPFDGVITQKHITVGEKLSTDADALTVADMSSVWVDLSVYQKDLPYVAEGQTVHITVGEGVPDAEGTVAYVFPIVDEMTRTCTARVILANPDRHLRPGLFVSADVHVGVIDVEVLVPRVAVQRLDDQEVVFVPAAGGFEARPVSVGHTSATHAEIEAGLGPGERYVAEGAFQLKAQMVTSGLGAHAGHGH